MSKTLSWAKLRTMPVEDWPPISEQSMLKIMVEQDKHYWPSGCANDNSTGKGGEFRISSGVLAQDDAVLKEWVEKNGSFMVTGGTCGSFMQAIKSALAVDGGVDRRGNRHLHADSTNPSLNPDSISPSSRHSSQPSNPPST